MLAFFERGLRALVVRQFRRLELAAAYPAFEVFNDFLVARTKGLLSVLLLRKGPWQLGMVCHGRSPWQPLCAGENPKSTSKLLFLLQLLTNLSYLMEPPLTWYVE